MDEIQVVMPMIMHDYAKFLFAILLIYIFVTPFIRDTAIITVFGSFISDNLLIHIINVSFTIISVYQLTSIKYVF